MEKLLEPAGARKPRNKTLELDYLSKGKLRNLEPTLARTTLAFLASKAACDPPPATATADQDYTVYFLSSLNFILFLQLLSF